MLPKCSPAAMPCSCNPMIMDYFVAAGLVLTHEVSLGYFSSCRFAGVSNKDAVCGLGDDRYDVVQGGDDLWPLIGG
jgi:hypothetical protein